MKRCRRRSRQRPAEAGRAALAAGLLLAGVFGAGCVTRGTHLEMVAERDQLQVDLERAEQQAELLRRSNRSLDDERTRLLEDLEDLRQAKQGLDRDISKLERSKALLTDHLRTREAQVEELSSLKNTYASLVSDLEAEVASGQIQIEQLREGLRLNLTQEILFPSGSDELNVSGQRVLRKVAERLKSLPHGVEVQGHSDTVPISGSLAKRFPTNWELAAARSSRVVRLLQEAGVDPARLVASSYGPFRPVAPNDTPENRARNRRIEIRLTPLPGAKES